MPTIVFAQPKGGAGKSTAALILATELAQKGAAVTCLDADRNKALVEWAELPGRPDNLTVTGDISEESIIDQMETAAQKTPFVIVDLEGTASLMVGYAISRADLVIIPTQGSRLDSKLAAGAVKLVAQQERAFKKKIPFGILYTRTSPAIKPLLLQDIQAQIRVRNLPVFETQLHDRAAFKEIFSYGGTLSSLDPRKVRNLDTAIANGRAFASEVVAKLRALSQGEEETRVARAG